MAYHETGALPKMFSKFLPKGSDKILKSASAPTSAGGGSSFPIIPIALVGGAAALYFLVLRKKGKR